MIAKHFNVTTATVSKALNNLPDISEDLKKKIIEYAVENNYIPDFFARGLKGAKTKVIGVILADNSNPAYTDIINGIGDTMDQAGFSIILCNSKEDWKRERQHLNVLLQKNVDGILVIPADTRGEINPSNRYEALDINNVPYVMINRFIEGCTADIVMPDNKYLSFMGTKYLIEKNHKNIIHLTYTMSISTVRNRIEGYKQAHEVLSVPFLPQNIYKCEQGYKSCYDLTIKLLQERNDFTAIYVYNDVMAFPVIRAILTTGRRIPSDIAVLSNDNIIYSNDCLVPLTTMMQDNYRIGQMAAEILLEKLTSETSSSNKVYLLAPTGIIERESV